MKRTQSAVITLVVFIVLGGAMFATASHPSRARTTSGVVDDAFDNAVARRADHGAMGAAVFAEDGRPTQKHVRPQNDPSAMAGAGAPPEASPEEAGTDPDESASANDNRPEQDEWRTQWTYEEHNPEWTARMQEELHARARTALHGDVDILEPSCRETLCIMHIKFADDLDVKAFQEASRGPDYHYELQSLDPNYNGEGFNEADFEYELIIKRGAMD